MRLTTEDGRTVKHPPKMRGVIHPDERTSTASTLRFAYRLFRDHGISRPVARAATHDVRVAVAVSSQLAIYSEGA